MMYLISYHRLLFLLTHVMLPHLFSLISFTHYSVHSGPHPPTSITHSFQLTHLSDKPLFWYPIFRKELTFQALNAVGIRKSQPCHIIFILYVTPTTTKVWAWCKHIRPNTTPPFLSPSLISHSHFTREW